MHFRVAEPLKKNNRSKHYDLVTALLETYEKYGNKKVIEVTLGDQESASSLSGVSGHLHTRVRGRPYFYAVHRCEVGPQRFHLWITAEPRDDRIAEQIHSTDGKPDADTPRVS